MGSSPISEILFTSNSVGKAFGGRPLAQRKGRCLVTWRLQGQILETASLLAWTSLLAWIRLHISTLPRPDQVVAFSVEKAFSKSFLAKVKKKDLDSLHGFVLLESL